VGSILLEKDASSKLADKRKGSLVDCLSFFDRDAIRAKPGELLDGANQALVGALRAVSREGRLQQSMHVSIQADKKAITDRCD
jgi:hypothetical protein